MANGLLNSTNFGAPSKVPANLLPPGVTVAGTGQTTAGAVTSTNVPQGTSQQVGAPAAAIAPNQKAQTPTPTAAPSSIPAILTQPADYSKPESQAEIDAYNQLALQAGKTGDYSALDSIGTNDERNVVGATWRPGYTANPAYIQASLSGKSTDGIAQWLPGASPAPTATPSVTQNQKATPAPAGTQITAYTGPNSTPTPAGPYTAPSPTPTPAGTTGSPVATTADINSIFNSAFGRPAADAGTKFYSDYLAANPGTTQAQLQAMIMNNAQTQDQAAAASLQGKGLLQNNWTNPALSAPNVATGQDVWDPATGQWTTAGDTSATSTGTPGAAPATLPTATSQGYTAAQDVVTPNQTVAGNLSNNLNANSPLMQEAATQGNEQSNARGLLNSSIGISAAENAMINAALPISQQDASTNAQASLANQSATNAASQFTSGAANQAALANLSTATQSMLQSMQDATSLATAKLSSTTQLALGQLSSTTQQTIQGMVNSNQQLLQTSTSSANAFNAAMNNIATIQQSSTMDASAKQDAVNNIITQLQNFMNAQSNIAKAGGVNNLPNIAQYFPSLAPSPTPASTAPTGNGTTPPTGAAEGSTYTSNGITYEVMRGVGVPTGASGNGP